jgi:hypothetical protein
VALRGVIAIVFVVVGLLAASMYRRVGEAMYRWRYRLLGRMGAPDEYATPEDQIASWRVGAAGLGLALIIIGIIDLIMTLSG